MNSHKKFYALLKKKLVGPLSVQDIEFLLQRDQINSLTPIFDSIKNLWLPFLNWSKFGKMLDSNLNINLESYLVISHGKFLGPVSKQEILEKLEAEKFSPFDLFISLEEIKWMILKEFISPQMKEIKSSDYVKDQDQKKDKDIWWIKKNDENLGPFHYEEILKMIQKNIIIQDTKLRKNQDEKWKMLADTKEFLPKFVKNLLKETKSISSSSKSNSLHNIKDEIFQKRRHKRAAIVGKAQIILNGHKYIGICSSLSIGGCFIEIRTPLLELKTEVNLKIQTIDDQIFLNVKAQVISRNIKVPKGLGFSFIDLDEISIKKIQEYVVKIIKER